MIRQVGQSLLRYLRKRNKDIVCARLITSRGYRPVRALKAGKAYRIVNNNESFAFKVTTDRGVKVLRDVLPALSGRLSQTAVPELVESGWDDVVGHWVITRWIDGSDFNGRWSEHDPATSGGRVISVDTIPRILDVLAELASARFVLPPQSRELVLSPTDIVARFRHWAPILEDVGLLTASESIAAEQALAPLFSPVEPAAPILTNGDFQFRNFIELSGKRLAVIDWDTARTSTFEIEHCVSYQCLLMWNNPVWQRRFLQEAIDRFQISSSRLRAALTMNAFMRVVTWRRAPSLVAIHRFYLGKLLEGTRCDDLWGEVSALCCHGGK